MKLRCPRCQQKLSVPDKYAGRAIRCPACNRAFSVPKPRTALDGPGSRAQLDLEGLAKLEAGSSQMDADELADAQTAVEAKKPADADREGVRTCPSCHKEVPVDDPYADVLCSHCWNPIPALIKGEGASRAKRIADAYKPPTIIGAGGFYAELISSVAYPISAIGSLGTATGIAVLAGFVPVAVITGGANLMELGAVGTAEGVQTADLSGAQLILTSVLAFEVVFFFAVALHAFLDVVRTTAIGHDRAPNLTWNPTQWGKSFLAYAILGVYLFAATVLVGWISLERNPLEYIITGNLLGLAKAGGTWFVVGMVVVSFGIPMNLMGISLGSIPQGLNPSKVFRSIGLTHAHYVFLVLILCVYGALFGSAFSAVVFDWLRPQVEAMIAGSLEGNVTQVALSLLAWGLTMGLFFYGTFVLARLHGLFARSFRKSLLFGGY